MITSVYCKWYNHQHLKWNDYHQFCEVFLVIIACKYERNVVFFRIFQKFLTIHSNIFLSKYL